MKLATIRLEGRTAAVRIDDGSATEISGAEDVGALLADPGWRDRAAGASGPAHPVGSLDYAPLIVDPGKIICVGLNYRTHILEMGRELPDYPTLFAKYTESLIGAYDEITLPAGSEQVDWEAELAVIIGTPVRHADEATARAAIAGYSILNDVTARDFQNRTLQFLQGKTFEGTTPLGPALVTADELPAGGQEMTCEVDGEVMQRADTSDLIFDAVTLVRYISGIITLKPGDVIATGTPGGVGHGRKPPRYLTAGSKVVTRIAGIGEQANTARPDATA